MLLLELASFKADYKKKVGLMLHNCCVYVITGLLQWCLVWRTSGLNTLRCFLFFFKEHTSFPGAAGLIFSFAVSWWFGSDSCWGGRKLPSLCDLNPEPSFLFPSNRSPYFLLRHRNILLITNTMRCCIFAQTFCTFCSLPKLVNKIKAQSVTISQSNDDRLLRQ